MSQVVPLGLVANSNTIIFSSLDDYQQIFSETMMNGRLMSVIYDEYGGCIGGIDLAIISGAGIVIMNFGSFNQQLSGSILPITMSMNSYAFNLSLDWRNNKLYAKIISDTEITTSLTFVTFFISGSGYVGENSYAIDSITENTTGHGIIIDSALEITTSTTGTVTLNNDTDIEYKDISCEAKRVGNICYISFNCSFNCVNNIVKEMPYNFATVTPGTKFNVHNVVGTFITNSYRNGIIINDANVFKIVFNNDMFSGTSGTIRGSVSFIL